MRGVDPSASVSIDSTVLASFLSTTDETSCTAEVLAAVTLAAVEAAAASDCTVAGVDILVSASVAIFFSVPSSSGPFLAGEFVPLPSAFADDGKSTESLPLLRASYRSFACCIEGDTEDDEEALIGGIPDLLRALVLVWVDAATATAAAPAGVLGAGLF